MLACLGDQIKRLITTLVLNHRKILSFQWIHNANIRSKNIIFRLLVKILMIVLQLSISIMLFILNKILACGNITLKYVFLYDHGSKAWPLLRWETACADGELKCNSSWVPFTVRQMHLVKVRIYFISFDYIWS